MAVDSVVCLENIYIFVTILSYDILCRLLCILWEVIDGDEFVLLLFASTICFAVLTAGQVTER